MFSGRLDIQGSNYVEIYAKMPKWIMFLFEILIFNTSRSLSKRGTLIIIFHWSEIYLIDDNIKIKKDQKWIQLISKFLRHQGFLRGVLLFIWVPKLRILVKLKFRSIPKINFWLITPKNRLSINDDENYFKI